MNIAGIVAISNKVSVAGVVQRDGVVEKIGLEMDVMGHQVVKSFIHVEKSLVILDHSNHDKNSQNTYCKVAKAVVSNA